ncbi:hypothetical protein LY76DRAFT_15567 [Colletotrichum caudatum]|nr:hypothetical protein LY76DRAFT_15567 [Colletotrichum caudatum]
MFVVEASSPCFVWSFSSSYARRPLRHSSHVVWGASEAPLKQQTLIHLLWHLPPCRLGHRVAGGAGVALIETRRVGSMGFSGLSVRPVCYFVSLSSGLPSLLYFIEAQGAGKGVQLSLAQSNGRGANSHLEWHRPVELSHCPQTGKLRLVHRYCTY